MQEVYQQETLPFVTYLAEEIGLEDPSERFETSLYFYGLDQQLQKLLVLVIQAALLV